MTFKIEITNLTKGKIPDTLRVIANMLDGWKNTAEIDISLRESK
jgi:hypothetical protein